MLQIWKIELVHLLDHHWLINLKMMKMKDPILLNKVLLVLRVRLLVVEKLWLLNTSATMEKWQWLFLHQNREEKERMYTRNITSRVQIILEILTFLEDIESLICYTRHFLNVIQDFIFHHFHQSKIAVPKRICLSMRDNISWINSWEKLQN